MSCTDFLLSILASLLASILFAGIAISLYLLWLILRRRNIRQFFGIVEQDRIDVFVSGMWVNKAYSSKPRNWNVPRLREINYQNIAVSALEISEAHSLQFMFQDVFRKFVDRFAGLGRLQVTDVELRVKPSPPEQHFTEREDSFIAIGGVSFSGAASFIESSLNPQAHFQRDSNDGNLFVRVNGVGDFRGLAGLGFLVRIVDHQKRRTVFYAAGLGTSGTCGPVYFLRQNWKELYARYGAMKDFYIVFQTGADHRRSLVVSETPYPHPSWKRIASSWLGSIRSRLET
jgi:hypothetical protein